MAQNADCLQLADMRIDPDTSKLAHHQVDGVEQYLSLQLLALPLAVTFGIVRDKLMCDPCHDEASQLASLIEVTVASGGNCCGASSSFRQSHNCMCEYMH